ncbi:rod shape-determining protein MreC [Rhizohabitans arisaemae]|uniref:rod shape-determining protein MreC n=1 Tax=Rhizohabitans arisaemae TaxID=2720610 RepID=UPI0024B2125D|nr:rod shape-determining protein MreC [Rhizohabitans arisaemae]
MRDTRRARFTLGILLAIALILVTVDFRGAESSPLGSLRSLGSSLFGGMEDLTTSVIRPVTSFFTMFTGAPEAQDRIGRLEAENAGLRRQLGEQRLSTERSAQLNRLLGTARLGQYKIVAASVIARRGVPGFEDSVELDAGRADGIRPNMTVINSDGLVGRVVHAGANTATVALITDSASSVGGRLEDSLEVGVVSGLGKLIPGGLFVRFQLLDSTAPIAEGQRIVSFGSDQARPYVPGVPIGVVQRVQETPGELTRIAYVRPFARISALDVVGVVVAAPARDPRDAVLPKPLATPSPSPTPTASPDLSETDLSEVDDDDRPRRPAEPDPSERAAPARRSGSR